MQSRTVEQAGCLVLRALLWGMVRGILYLISLVFFTSLTVWLIAKYAPSEHNPFQPISLSDPIGVATYHKIIRLKGRSEACFDALSSAGVSFTRLEDTLGPKVNCGFSDALTLDQSLFPYSATLRMTCPLTAALMIWEREVAAPAAQDILGSSIVRIETFGSFACRRMYSSSRGRWSEHATGNAVDISGFRLADGRLISLEGDWGKSTPEGRFLKQARDGACRVFSVVLGPDYNRAHADHFHFDLGGGDVCS